MNPQIHALQQIFGALFGGVAKNAQSSVKSVRQVARAVNSVNPLYAQPALSPESLRPDQNAHHPYVSPYNVNGHQVPVGWAMHFPEMHLGSPHMPATQLPSFPTYQTKPMSSFENITTGVDQPIFQIGPFTPQAQMIPAQGKPAQYKRPRFQS